MSMRFDPTLPLLLALALGALAVGPSASSAQPVQRPLVTPDSTERDSLRTDSSQTDASGADARAAAARPVSAAGSDGGPPARPVVHVFGGSGLRVTLPAGWDGPVLSDETRLPGYALYTFENRQPGLATTNASVYVERVVGLNPLDEQRWRFGQVRYGYHGTRPVARLAVPLPALASYLVEGDGKGGAVAFLQRGRTFWTVSVFAPPALWATRRSDILALMTAVDLPE